MKKKTEEYFIPGLLHFLDFIQLAAYGSTVKPVLVILPPGVVTLIEPEVAPVGTTTVIWVALFTRKTAGVVLNCTE